MPDDDKLLVVPLGEESKTITQTIANDTAMRILDLLAETPLSTSAIAKKLDIPLTTAQYNMEKLIEAGLAKVEKTKYSEKGREVKLYAPAKRFIVLVPEKTTGPALVEALKKYLFLVPVALIGSVAIEYLSSLQGNSLRESALPITPPLITGYVAGVNHTAVDTASQATGQVMANGYGVVYMASNETMSAGASFGEGTALPAAALPKATVQPAIDHLQQSFMLSSPLNHAGVWFFLGCVLILALIAVYEYARIKKIKMPWTKK